eukprot:SAG31_NODE_7318_length_1720_cov_2.404688_3_plen_89_part_00
MFMRTTSVNGGNHTAHNQLQTYSDWLVGWLTNSSVLVAFSNLAGTTNDKDKTYLLSIYDSELDRTHPNLTCMHTCAAMSNLFSSVFEP